jgi:hypothetical protein
MGLPDAPLAEVKQRLDVMLATDLTLERFGAVGDGLSHPVSELHPTLAAARAAYPDYITHQWTVPYASGSSSTIDLPYNADPDEHGGFSGGRYKVTLTGGTGSGQTLDISSAATTVVSTTTITAGSGTSFTVASGTGLQVGMYLDATMNGVRQVRRIATINTGTGVGTVSTAWYSVVTGSSVRVVRFIATLTGGTWSPAPDATTTASLIRQVVLADERDLAAVQYVFSRLDLTGGFVVLNPGSSYRLNETAWRVSFSSSGVSRPGIYFRGPGYNGATFLSACVGVPMFRFIGCRTSTSSFIQGGGFSGCEFDGTPGSGSFQHAIYTQGVLNFTLTDFLAHFFDGDFVHDTGDTNINVNPDFTSGGNWLMSKGNIQRIGGYAVWSEIPLGFYGCDFVQMIAVFTGKSSYYINGASHRFVGCSQALAGYLSETVVNDDGINYYGIEFRAAGTVVRLAISDCEIQANKTGHIAISGLSTVEIIRTRFIWDPEPAPGGGSFLAPPYGIRIAEQGLASTTTKKLTMRRCIARIDAVGNITLCQFDAVSGVSDIEIREWDVQGATTTGTNLITPFAGYTVGASHLSQNFRLSTAARMFAAGRPPVHQLLTLAATMTLTTSFVNVPFETLDATTGFAYPIKQGMSFTATISGGSLATLVVANQGRGLLVPSQTGLALTITGGGGTLATATCDTDPQGYPVNPVITNGGGSANGGTDYTSAPTVTLDTAGLWDNINHRYVVHEDGLYWVTFSLCVNAQAASDWCRVALFKATTIGGTPAAVAGTEAGGIGMATPMNRFRWNMPPKLMWLSRGNTIEVQATCTNSKTTQTAESYFQIIRTTENPL